MSRYTVRLVELTPEMARAKDYTFKVDPSKSNKFVLELEPWRSIHITIQPKRWWEFWK